MKIVKSKIINFFLNYQNYLILYGENGKIAASFM